MSKMDLNELHVWMPHVLNNAADEGEINAYNFKKFDSKLKAFGEAAECLRLAYNLGYLGGGALEKRVQKSLENLGFVV
jgi:predicted membrane chloride channel (bestrophin family)